MDAKPIRTRRVVVISDLHLGGPAPAMMSGPDDLAKFIRALPQRCAEDERLELVIAGDFVDFLAIEPFASWTPSTAESKRKLESTMADRRFAPVFHALAEHIASGHLLTILVGNHDVELALPAVQGALLAELGATHHQVHLVDDNRAYQVGGLLIEHGNRYDGANENDWAGLRAIASALSRGEEPRDVLEISAGSRLVEKIISPLKAGGYPFIDLMQPQNELVALLLLAFEPSLLLDLPKIARILRGRQLEKKNETGQPPGQTRNVAFQPARPKDQDLLRAFGEAYETLLIRTDQVSVADLAITAWKARKHSLADLLQRGGNLPTDRLEQIRVSMAKLLLGDTSDRLDGSTEQYGAAAERIIQSSHGIVEVVVMGHTHLPRHIGPAQRATYINTGTWADVIRVPGSALEQGNLSELQEFLRGLCAGEHRSRAATWADIRIEADGSVSSARLLSEPLK